MKGRIVVIVQESVIVHCAGIGDCHCEEAKGRRGNRLARTPVIDCHVRPWRTRNDIKMGARSDSKMGAGNDSWLEARNDSEAGSRDGS